MATTISRKAPKKINSVLSRFEETIRSNEEAGGNSSGMYLSNLASKRATVGGGRISMAGLKSATPQPLPSKKQQLNRGRSLILPHNNKQKDSCTDEPTVSTADMSECDFFQTPKKEVSYLTMNDFDRSKQCSLSNHSRKSNNIDISCSNENDDSDSSFAFDDEIDFDDPFAQGNDDLFNTSNTKQKNDDKESKKASTSPKKPNGRQTTKNAGRLSRHKSRTGDSLSVCSKSKSPRKESKASKSQKMNDGFSVTYVAPNRTDLVVDDIHSNKNTFNKSLSNDLVFDKSFNASISASSCSMLPSPRRRTGSSNKSVSSEKKRDSTLLKHLNKSSPDLDSNAGDMLRKRSSSTGRSVASSRGPSSSQRRQRSISSADKTDLKRRFNKSKSGLHENSASTGVTGADDNISVVKGSNLRRTKSRQKSLPSSCITTNQSTDNNNTMLKSRSSSVGPKARSKASLSSAADRIKDRLNKSGHHLNYDEDNDNKSSSNIKLRPSLRSPKKVVRAP